MGAGRLFRYRLSSARQRARSTRRRALIESERAGKQTSPTFCFRSRSSCPCCWLRHSSQRITYGFQASKERSVNCKSNESYDSVSQDACPGSGELQPNYDHRNRPNSLNDRRRRGGQRFIHRRRNFAGEFIHRHLPIPRQGQTAFNERHVIDDGLALL